MEVQLRRATDADAQAIADVWLLSRKAAITIPPAIHSDDETRQWFADVVLTTMEVWVACTPQIVGLLVLREQWVEQLYVHPEWTGRGIGASLLTLAKSRRPGQLELWTFETNRRARAFYENHDFSAIERSADNEERAMAIRYRWSPEDIDADGHQ